MLSKAAGLGGETAAILAGADLAGLAAPPARGERRIVRDDEGTAAAAIAAFLVERRLL